MFCPIKILIVTALCSLFIFDLGAGQKLNPARTPEYRLSVMTGSFLYHADFKSSVQYFNNRYFTVSYRYRNNREVFLGSAVNSYGERIIIVGFAVHWYQFNDRISLLGGYTYAGNFFFPFLSEAGTNGVYKMAKDNLGIAFAPLISHFIEIDINRRLSILAGNQAPASFVSVFRLKIG